MRRDDGHDRHSHPPPLVLGLAVIAITAMLAACGELNLARPEGSLVAKVIGDRPISLIGLDKRVPSDLDGSVHRSVYLPIIRDRLPEALDLFNFAEPSLVTGQREITNVPLQALYLMNSPFVSERAKQMGARLTVKSHQGHGTEVRVEVPLKPTAPKVNYAQVDSPVNR